MLILFTRWPEVIPISDISAEAGAKSFITNWISRFGVLVIITTDQGGQFQSRLLYSLKQMLGIQRIRTTPTTLLRIVWLNVSSYPQASYSVSRYKMDRVATSGPVGLRACIKEDLNASCAEMVFGKLLCFQENSLNLQVRPQLIPPSFFPLKGERNISDSKPTPASCHSSTPMFRAHSPQNLLLMSLLRVEGLKPSLTAPYQGPFEVLSNGPTSTLQSK
ncbi:transposon Tf2-6 polyprotein [Trichonephila inaurata madagascariensis]|uniref:Transposon Tf2-6 polyprotein n=1 Tax=Trichonephila inaurata madagascariensis TaxID=2747483 RepID=A0A8X7CDB2_9ARAC|nr:transposon Tf2-6 polyprotein [Trichonephila inaurata madagascariensis]